MTTDNDKKAKGALLQAAESCFAAIGGEQVRLSDVTAAAGLTTGALYWHFDNLDDLARTLFDEYDAGLLGILEGASSIVEATEGWVRLLTERPGTARLVVESARPDRPLATAKAAARQGWIDALDALLPEVVPVPERYQVTRLVVNTIEGLALAGATGWAPMPDPEELAATIGRLTGTPAGPAAIREREGPRADDAPSAVSLQGWRPDPSKQTPTTTRGRATFEAIQEGALEVFATKGIIDATVADFARRAGVSPGTVYQYFVDKHDVFRSVLFRAQGELLPAVELPPVDARPPIGPAMFAYLSYSRTHAGLFRAFMESIVTGGEYAAIWQSVRNQFARWAEAVARAGQDAGHLPTGVRPALLAQITFDTAVRCAYERVVLGWDADATDGAVARVFERLISGAFELPDK